MKAIKILKFLVLITATLLLFALASWIANAERGHFAVGGEALILLLPVAVYIAKKW